MKKNLIIALIIMFGTFLSAERNLSLEESIQLALQNNKELQKAREEMGKYRQEYNIVRANLMPQISLSGGYNFKRTILPDSAIPELPSLSTMLDSTATANDQVIAGYIDNGFASFIPEAESDEYTLAGSVKLEQAVFLGGKLINGIKIARKLYTLEEKKYYLSEQNLIFETQDKYYQTKLAGEVAKIQGEALEFAELYYQQVSDMQQQGMVSEYDKLRAELEVKKMQPQVLEAEKNAKLALQSFANHLNIEEVELNLTDGISLPQMQEIDLESALARALKNRMELELSEIGVEVGKVNLRYEKGNFLPNIGITAEYNYFGTDQSKIEADDWGSSYSVGIGFSMPLFTGFSNNAKIKKARHSLQQSRLDHQALQEMIRLDVRNSYLQWQADLEKVDTQVQNQELAEMGWQIAQARYENQISNQLEVIDAQLQMKTAKLNYMNARYAAAISYQRLQKAMGKDLKK
ncbi:MAG: TolC family protein [Candidatus Cloacimonadales bacterium]